MLCTTLQVHDIDNNNSITQYESSNDESFCFYAIHGRYQQG